MVAGADALIAAVAAANPKTVVAAVAPGAVLTPWRGVVAAATLAFMPGQEYAPRPTHHDPRPMPTRMPRSRAIEAAACVAEATTRCVHGPAPWPCVPRYGGALSDILFGAVAPSAKLPLTLPVTETDLNMTNAMWPGGDTPGGCDGAVRVPCTSAVYSEHLLVGYRYYDHHRLQPAFAFGHGLTYTRFALSDLKVVPAAATATASTAVAAAAAAATATATVALATAAVS